VAGLRALLDIRRRFAAGAKVLRIPPDNGRMATTITLADGSKVSTPTAANAVAERCLEGASLVRIETVAQNIVTWINPSQIVSIVEIGAAQPYAA
jgi:hypothetical protein